MKVILPALTFSARQRASRIFLLVRKCAASDRTGNVHYHGQIPACDQLFSAGMEDPMLFPLIRDAYFVSSVVLSILGEIVTVEWLELTPLVASQH